jgi:hypothetical protein
MEGTQTWISRIINFSNFHQRLWHAKYEQNNIIDYGIILESWMAANVEDGTRLTSG